MQMIVREVDGKRLWSFTVNEKQLYELLCTQIAWRVLKKKGEDVSAVEKTTTNLAAHCHTNSDEQIKAITDIFVRAVFAERKRLKLEEYQLKVDDDE